MTYKDVVRDITNDRISNCCHLVLCRKPEFFAKGTALKKRGMDLMLDDYGADVL
jgi:hypothetical protein